MEQPVKYDPLRHKDLVAEWCKKNPDLKTNNCKEALNIDIVGVVFGNIRKKALGDKWYAFRPSATGDAKRARAARKQAAFNASLVKFDGSIHTDKLKKFIKENPNASTTEAMSVLKIDIHTRSYGLIRQQVLGNNYFPLKPRTSQRTSNATSNGNSGTERRAYTRNHMYTILWTKELEGVAEGSLDLLREFIVVIEKQSRSKIQMVELANPSAIEIREVA